MTLTDPFSFGSTAWPSNPTMPTAPPDGYIAPVRPQAAAADPPMTEGEAESHRQNFIELILQQVAQALFGFTPGDGSAKAAIAEWAINLITEIGALPGKTWDFIKEDLWGLGQKLFSGDFIGIWRTVWRWVTNFIGITGNGGILSGLGAVGQWIKGLFGNSTGDPDGSLADQAVTGVKNSSIFSGIVHFFQTAWEFVSGLFGIFGSGSLLGNIWHTLRGWWDKLMQGISGVWHFITSAFGIFSNDGSVGANIWNTLKGLWDKAGQLFSGVVNFFQSAIGIFTNDGSIGSHIWNFLKSAWDKIVQGFTGVWNFFSSIVRAFTDDGSIWGNIWHTVQTMWNKVVGFFIHVWNTVQKVWDWLTGEGSVIGQARSMLSGLTTIKTRFGETSVGGLITDAASIVSNPDGDQEGSLTQKAYKAIWPVINCFGWVGKGFELGKQVTGFIDNPTGSITGSIVEGAFNKLGLNNIAGKAGAVVGDNAGAVVNFFASPKDPSSLFGGQSLASYAVGKATSFLGFGDLGGAGGLFGTATNVGGDFFSMLGSPTGLGTGYDNWTMGPMLPPVNLFNSFGALNPFQFGTMPAGAVAATPTHASNLVNEGAFRSGITVADQTEGWSWDDIDGRTIPGCLLLEHDGFLNEMVANQIPVVAGQTYDLSAYIKWSDLTYTGSNPVCIGITGYDYEPLTKTYSELESVDVAFLASPASSGDWTLIDGTYTVPAINTPDVVRFRLKVGGNADAGAFVRFDEITAVNPDLVQDAVVPGIGSILDNGVNGLENLGLTGWGHTDFFSAMFGQNSSTVGLATRVSQLENTAPGVTSVTDLFERFNSTDLGGNWSLTYSGAGAGNWSTPNAHDAAWTPVGTSDREVLARYTGSGATSTGDNQKITAVLGSKAETDYYGAAAHNYLLGRVSSDMLNYILADFDGNGNISIIRCLAGVRTVLGSTTVTTVSSGATIGLMCGTGSGARYFQALINNQAVDFSGSDEVSDATSALGASYRGRGHGALAKSGTFGGTLQLNPGAYNSWSSIDL